MPSTFSKFASDSQPSTFSAFTKELEEKSSSFARFAEKASGVVTSLTRATRETIEPPTTIEAGKRLLTPTPGAFGLGRFGEEQAAEVERVAGGPITSKLIETLPETSFGQKFPKITAGIGTAAEIVRPIIPGSLRPSKLPGLAATDVLAGSALKLGGIAGRALLPAKRLVKLRKLAKKIPVIKKFFKKKQTQRLLEIRGAKDELTQTVKVKKAAAALKNAQRPNSEFYVNESNDLVAQATKTKDVTRLEALILDQGRVARQIDGSFTGPYHKQIFEPLIDAINNQTLQANSLKKTATKIFKDTGMGTNKNVQRQFIDFVEGTLDQTAIDPKILSAYKKAEPLFRKIDNQLIAETNKALVASGKPPMKFLENHVAHVRKINVLQDLYGDITKVPDNIIDEYIKATSKSTPFAKSRLPNASFELAPFNEAFNQYVDSVTKTIHYSPIINKMSQFSSSLKKAGKNRTAKVIQDVANNLSGIPFPIDDALGFTTPIGRFLNRAVGRLVKNKIIGNVDVALNQFAGVAQLAAEVGPIRAVGSVTASLGRNIGANILKIVGNKEYANFAQTFSRSVRLRMTQGIPEATGFSKVGGLLEKTGIPKVVGTIEQAVLKPLRFTDRVVMEASFNASYAKAVKGGLSHDFAVKFADDRASAAQAFFAAALRPLGLQTKIGKLLAPIQTMAFNNFNIIFKDILGSRVRNLSKVDAAIALGRYISGAILFNLAKKMIGGRPTITPTSFFPGSSSAKFGPPLGVRLARDVIGTVTGQKGSAKALGKTALFGLLPPFGGRQIEKLSKGQLITPGEKKKNKGLF